MGRSKEGKVGTFKKHVSNHPVWSTVIILGLVVVAIGQFTNALATVWDFVARFGSADAIDTAIKDDEDLAEGRPIRFDLEDERLSLFKRFNLKKEEGATLLLGNYPEPPSAKLTLQSMRIAGDNPHVNMEVTMASQGYHLPPSVLGVTLQKGCGFTALGPDWNLVFEISDDRVSHIEGWVAILGGSLAEGEFMLLEKSCPSSRREFDSLLIDAGLGGYDSLLGGR